MSGLEPGMLFGAGERCSRMQIIDLCTAARYKLPRMKSESAKSGMNIALDCVNFKYAHGQYLQ